MIALAILILTGLLSVEKGSERLLVLNGYQRITTTEVSATWCGSSWSKAAAYTATHYTGRSAVGMVCCRGYATCTVR